MGPSDHPCLIIIRSQRSGLHFTTCTGVQLFICAQVSNYQKRSAVVMLSWVKLSSTYNGQLEKSQK